MRLWGPGTQIVWRYGDPSKPHVAAPVTVVEDSARWLVAWLPVGTRYRTWARADGLPQRGDRATLFSAARVDAYATWYGFDVLRVYEKGRRWSTWLFFSQVSGRFDRYYCNIEATHVRGPDSTSSYDHILDVEVAPDRTVRRKDEDELVLAVEQGRFNSDEAAGITAVADEIDAVVARWGSPFRDGWETFRPDPAWELPQLPEAYDFTPGRDPGR
ncbi:MAG: DUF402 domain-containing protein [Nocardioides sp.]|nr:DUF402 domain-containing protein [Nocardioides sp.]